jgi:hypothetical protein
MKHFIQAMKGAKNQMLIPARMVDGKELPEVMLPRFHYYDNEMGRERWARHGIFVNQGTEGAYRFIERPVIELDDEHFAACEADPNFMGMVKKGSYLVLDALPARFHNQSEETRALLAKYRAALEKAGIPIPTLGDELSDEMLEVMTRPDGKTA